MLQRIQTIYLLLVAILGTILCFFSPVEFVSAEGSEVFRQLTMTFTGIVDITVDGLAVPLMNTVSLSIISVAIVLLALVDIFLYRKRILQARLNIITVILCLGWYAILSVYVWFAVMNYYVEWHITVWAAIPLVNMVLTLMATRAILKDEALVRAADRLR